MEKWETIAFHPEFPSVPGILVGQDLSGRPQVKTINPIGGAALIDRYACAALTGLLASNPHPDISDADTVQTAWELAIEMAKQRPRFTPPPAAIYNHKPRLVE